MSNEQKMLFVMFVTFCVDPRDPCQWLKSSVPLALVRTLYRDPHPCLPPCYLQKTKQVQYSSYYHYLLFLFLQKSKYRHTSQTVPDQINIIHLQTANWYKFMINGHCEKIYKAWRTSGGQWNTLKEAQLYFFFFLKSKKPMKTSHLLFFCEKFLWIFALSIFVVFCSLFY